MIGVALISVTLVPALIPTFIKGRLRERGRKLDRPQLHQYLQAAADLGLAAAQPGDVDVRRAADPGGRHVSPAGDLRPWARRETAWRDCVPRRVRRRDGADRDFHARLALAGRCRWRAWCCSALWAYHFPKIGVAFMPPLDEGRRSTCRSRCRAPASPQSADDLKARDALLRGFPEVESVIGKAGRADTPTDPAPLDMVETFVNFRPKELWPKRVLKYRRRRTGRRATCWQRWKRAATSQPRADTTDDRDKPDQRRRQKALERFDETMRELALLRYQEFERELGPVLTRFAVDEDDAPHARSAATLHWPRRSRTKTARSTSWPTN